MNILKEFIKSVAAGIMIGIGGSVYLNTEPKFAGAVIFSVGLMSIILFKMNLYTGKVGYVSSLKDAANCIVYILGNAVGCGFVALINNPAAKAIAQAKLQISYPQLFLKAILCGVLMYAAVEIYKSNKSLLGVFFCVPAFILGGFEHSIADIYYFLAARSFTVKTLIVTVVIILGNAVGGILLNLFKNKLTENS